MFRKIRLEDFKKGKNAVVLGADVFYSMESYGKKKLYGNTFYCVKLLEGLASGLFDGLITDLEYGKLKRRMGEQKVHNFFNKHFRRNKKARVFEIAIAKRWKEYKRVEGYEELFDLVMSTNLHVPDLTSIIVAIELQLPLVTYDPHPWRLQNPILRAFRRRYSEERKKDLTEGRKPRDFLLLTPRDFYQVLEKSAAAGNFSSF